MDPLLCFPADLPAEVTLALQGVGLGHRSVAGPEELAAPPAAGGPRAESYSGALVVAAGDMTPEEAVVYTERLQSGDHPTGLRARLSKYRRPRHRSSAPDDRDAGFA